MRAKAQKIAINLRQALEGTKAKERRFITFTLKSSDQPLDLQIRRLYKAFRKVRSSKLWKRTQKGGAAMLEVKWNEDHWHPHLHVVVEGSWIRQGDLSSLWHDATGDSFIVDIKLLENCDKTIAYVTKYVTKSVPPNVWDDEQHAIEWMMASKGVRTCLTFGSWRGIRLTATKKEAGTWKRLCSVNSLYEACCRAEPWALALVRAFDQQRHTEHNNANRPPPTRQVV